MDGTQATKGIYDAAPGRMMRRPLETRMTERERMALTVFLCGAAALIALTGWGIWLACGRWPALCRIVPMAGAYLLGIGTMMVVRSKR